MSAAQLGFGRPGGQKSKRSNASELQGPWSSTLSSSSVGRAHFPGSEVD